MRLAFPATPDDAPAPMSTHMLIAIALTTLMIVVHIGLFWWFVLRQAKPRPPAETHSIPPDDPERG